MSTTTNLLWTNKESDFNSSHIRIKHKDNHGVRLWSVLPLDPSLIGEKELTCYLIFLLTIMADRVSL